MSTNEEVRFTMNMVGGIKLGFIRRPVSMPAKEGTIAFLDGLTEKGNHGRQVGVFLDGEWRGGAGGGKLRITPQTWTISADMDGR